MTTNDKTPRRGRPDGSKSIAGNRKEIRRFMSRMAKDFKANYEKMTPTEKNQLILKYLNGEI